MKKRLSFLIFLFLWSGLLIAQRDTTSAIQRAKEMLEKKHFKISEILTDSSFDFIKSKTEFRKLIQQHASDYSISITGAKEPGAKILTKGIILNKTGIPVKNTLVYVYQTSTLGWYGSDRPHFLEMEGDRKHARIFGYLYTSDKGEFEVKTIQPNGYPNSDLPAHIHFEVFDANGRAIKITELLFDDDVRLKAAIRQRGEQEGFIIAKPEIISGRKVFFYKIKL